ncbi:threonine synthase [Clostridium pasteurianum DSM 525 = ATCC 6013]|uniref:Threonine synthase n=1 Tax=Clostridium pasteurianum DSM 525 = ATCC 6013 TaxID=1262449 RepID=A0A0H3JA28_CLOPA|nr:threonine synthase [Clostridium pasteurianum]AJA49188.1 threonine synthase [Clostridium pasteurianum DSM 525 = ATCC 6013]AJA53176.1 threonine synthase [Clostridium pasteurianum DSM 525 = ATCC 6013]AOZ76371.1 threonine synthase [Clostridium pasteurianum DSM 525 = ATCC 6013]AOZ80168.1 threonine synthase [Clostridium pasteurianum]ELP59120.1 threonine synthase [Clostridium pasteurianum DSM 525 = ATCC 6013]
MSYFSYLQCSKCGKEYSKDEPHNLCECGGPLLVRYDLHSIKENVDKNLFKTREKGLFRFKELLPIEDEKNIVSLGEGDTPILKADSLGEKIGAENLYIKDEGLNPTGTFKSRGAAVGVSKAKELGIKTIAMPTAGNAGGAWSAYSAKAGIELIVAMPKDAPDLAKKEAFIYGSRTYLVKGLISDAGKIIAKGVKKYGWFDAATLKEPYRIEGKKTMGLELAEYFNWEFPDAILYPTGGGVGIIGIWKAFKELKELGWIKDKIPKLIAVQAEGCNPIVKAFNENSEASEFYTGANTIAGGIRVPKALGDFIVLDAVRQSKGTAIEVKDSEIIESLNLLAKTEGLFVAPEGATLVAAADKLIKNGFLKSTDKIVLLNTGCGLKYANLVEEELQVLEIDADI